MKCLDFGRFRAFIRQFSWLSAWRFPATPLPELSDLRRRRSRIQDRLAGLGDLRPGTLIPRFRKCGKPTCHCAAEGDTGHETSRSLTWTVEGKTQTRVIPAGAVGETQAQIATHRRARSLARERFEVSAQMRDVQHEALTAAKKTSRRGGRTGSRPRA